MGCPTKHHPKTANAKKCDREIFDVSYLVTSCKYQEFEFQSLQLLLAEPDFFRTEVPQREWNLNTIPSRLRLEIIDEL